jgi:O-6-methylguanine DNA methyltransferase
MMTTRFMTDFIDTPLGQMGAVMDEQYLIGLFFMESQFDDFESMIKRYQAGNPFSASALSVCLKHEIKAYFEGRLTTFTVPYRLFGTSFQQRAWGVLEKIPFGNTINYAQQADQMGHSQAVRAVAAANSKNQLSLIVPCHRVIYKNGRIGGYRGGIERKIALLAHEEALGFC